MSRRRAQREEARANFLEENPHLPHHETTVDFLRTPEENVPFGVTFEQDNEDAQPARIVAASNFSDDHIVVVNIEGPHFSLSENSTSYFLISDDGLSIIDSGGGFLNPDYTISGDETLALELFSQNPDFEGSTPSPTPVEPKGGKSVEFDVQVTGAGGVTITLLDDDDMILIERKFFTTFDAEQQFSAEVELPQGVFFDEAQIQAIGQTEFTVTGLSFVTNYEPGFDPMAIA